MKKLFKQIYLLSTITCLAGCVNSNFQMGTYGYDKQFLSERGIETVELKSDDGLSRLLIAPVWQGRVLTSTTGGDEGISYGWINHRYIDQAQTNEIFNPYGGEERFWIGPEGGPYSWYFKKGVPQVYENWVVPAGIDTEVHNVQHKSHNSVVLTHRMDIRNASDHLFNIGMRRVVTLMEKKDIEQLLSVNLASDLKVIGYKTENSLKNEGCAWRSSPRILCISFSVNSKSKIS